jgi:hypothetical protein
MTMSPGINPYRDMAIESLALKSPAQIGLHGGTPMWGWIGRLYLHVDTRLSGLFPDAVLPDIAFDLLTGGCCNENIYRGYLSRQAAIEALGRARMQLEGG